ncbi:hypothetical protein [Mesobacillus selenatarsenatis]|uniref:Uncharacterized protein n=1 Tax=Mesobacillus selenatarsenatis (strain DSM 18680 / JCM 14380 / FERM P-15431 / SF-1) TaxID=1321606 RepID=A0A0A8X8V0_MESS1|nr:hypothetical protein [Mesobacillus selenatarsenatis]GAM15432.1 hypothetical protein SAMD00020551_3589 [Mesobacillus selenatarsenatis SF-1]
MGITYNSQLKLHQLVFREEKQNYIVEDTITNEFYEMPKVCIEAIKLIQDNVPLNEIEINLKKQYADEEIDIIEFVNQLVELEIVCELDGEKVSINIVNKKDAGFQWVPERLGQILFNDTTTKIYVGMLIASIMMFIFDPGLIPHFKDIFIFELMIENVAAIILITLILVLLHEFGHIIAIRGEGLNAKLELGHRLFFAVLETDLTQAWKLPPQKRNKLLYAGMYIDIVVIFTSLILLLVSTDGLLSGVLGIVVFNTLIRLIYQLCVFMKTDFYYIIENITGCYNLMENGQHYLSKRIPFIKTSHATVSFSGEEKVIRRYAYFYIIGILLTLIITAYYYIPQLIFAVNEIMLPGFFEPITSIRFWDSVVFLLQILLVSGLLIYSWTKKYRLSS